MRYVLAILAVLAGGAANAQTPPCVSVDPGWTQTYTQGSIQYISYNLTTKDMVFTFYGSPPTNRIFMSIPQSIAQQMYGLTNPTNYFNSNIANQYAEALLTTYQSNLCPIRNETQAYLWTHPNSHVPPPVVCVLLQSDGGIQLQNDAGTLNLCKG